MARDGRVGCDDDAAGLCSLLSAVLRSLAPEDGGAVAGRRPTAAALPWGAGTWAIVLQPGAGVADLMAALGRLPGGACFDQAHGDVDLLLVYRTPGGPVPEHDGDAGAGVPGATPARMAAPPVAGCLPADGAAPAGGDDEGGRVVAGVVAGLTCAVLAVEGVARLLGEADAPWDFVRATLLGERAGAVLGDLRHMAARAAEVRP